MRDRLASLLSEAEGLVNNDLPTVEQIADYLLANGVAVMPCKVGDTVYKICPKCNKDHSGSCERCAWRGCFMTGCDVGVRVWHDGSHEEHEKQIVPYKVTQDRIVTIIKYWNIMYFATEEEARSAMTEYNAICKIEDRKERYAAYKAWEASREIRYPFLERSAE